MKVLLRQLPSHPALLLLFLCATASHEQINQESKQSAKDESISISTLGMEHYPRSLR
jgi:hypothetical protein